MVTPFYSVRSAFFRFASLFRRQQLDRELSDEFESHLQFHTEENLRNGLPPGQARRSLLISPPAEGDRVILSDTSQWSSYERIRLK